MIAAGAELKLYLDDAQLNGKVISTKLKKNQEMELVIPTNGATLIVN